MQIFLQFLGDGRFHGLNELQQKTELNDKQTKQVVAFLTEFGFAEMSYGNEKVKISEAARKLFAQTARALTNENILCSESCIRLGFCIAS